MDAAAVSGLKVTPALMAEFRKLGIITDTGLGEIEINKALLIEWLERAGEIRKASPRPAAA